MKAESAAVPVVHTPVLPEETLRYLAPQNLAPGAGGGWMIDATLGEGGHSELFLARFPALRITGVDADAAVLETARARLERFGGRISFYRGWSEDFFSRIQAARGVDAPALDGNRPAIILMDLGVSLYHYEKGDRGFSFRADEPLDMRIDSERGMSAAALLAALREEEIAALLWQNAEERNSRRIARAIVKARALSAIESSRVLAGIVAQAAPAPRGVKLHPATKTFQALRIAVNGELEKLPGRLDAAFSALAAGGRLGVISFHSLEDRIVKHFFRGLARQCVCPPDVPICKCRGKALARLVLHKPVGATPEEQRRNPASRSALLRVVEKL